MKTQLKKLKIIISVFMILSVFVPFYGFAQEEQHSFSRDSLISAAQEIIKANSFCALVTVDATGQSQVRTMNPFPLNDDFVIWFATSRKSRKVTEIKNDPRVSVYYADHSNAKGYVNINGNAEIIDDKDLLIKMKRAYWENIPDWQNIFVLIKITPKTLDVINYARGINGKAGTNRSPSIIF